MEFMLARDFNLVSSEVAAECRCHADLLPLHNADPGCVHVLMSSCAQQHQPMLQHMLSLPQHYAALRNIAANRFAKSCGTSGGGEEGAMGARLHDQNSHILRYELDYKLSHK